jgi:hypothetical protein
MGLDAMVHSAKRSGHSAWVKPTSQSRRRARRNPTTSPGDRSSFIHDALYLQWIEHIFGRPDEKPRDLFFEFGVFPASDRELVELIRLTMSRSGEDLKIYTDEHIHAGLSGIFSVDYSCIGHSLQQAGFSANLEAAINAIEALYVDLFTCRCSPTLSHLNEVGNPVNAICYMLWDVTVLGYWEGRPDREAGQTCIAELMRRVLSIEHDACRESALHGLGHLAHYRSDLVEPIVGEFLRSSGALRPELRHYAECAALGRVQ